MRVESLVARPKTGLWMRCDTREQVGIDKAEACAEQCVFFNKAQLVIVTDLADQWQAGEEVKEAPSPRNMAERQLGDHERVHE